jgi:hypothetical protein
MTPSGTTALIFALGVWMTPPSVGVRATGSLGAAGITTRPETPVEVARQRRYPKCTRFKRAPCEMLLPEEESSAAV